MAVLTANLTTKVRNISPKTKTFACLPRSKRLAPGEEYTFDGDVVAALKGNKRKLAGLQAALAARVLAIVTSPNVHLYDATLDNTKVIRLDNGTLSVTDPSWGAYSSSIDAGEDGV